jgi:short-subunit dehydrogenase
VLAKIGGGAFLNVLSAARWINSGAMTAYAMSKAAAWSLSNGLRNELRQQGTQVLGLHVGFVDTDLARGLDVAFDALEAGASEVLPTSAPGQSNAV